MNSRVLAEILSDSTEAYDRGKKFQHFRTIPSLMPYVRIAQDRYSIECFARQVSDNWLMSVCYGLTGSLELAVIDCWLAVAEVYDRFVFNDAA